MEWLDAFHDLIGREDADITSVQMTIRGVLIFLYGLVLVRLAGRRAFGKAAAFDIVLAVLVGSNLSRALTGNAPFFPTLAATAGIALVHWIIAYLAYLSKFIGRLTKGNVVQLVRDGEIDWKKMRKFGLSEGDLEEAMRTKGTREIIDVDAAYLERNGSISIIQKPSRRRRR